MPALLREAGGPEVAEEGEDAGFIYYTRFFRSADGSTPRAARAAELPVRVALDPHAARRRGHLVGDALRARPTRR